MSWSFCNIRFIKKTRRPHPCSFCGRLISIGATNIYNWCGVYEGSFQNHYACNWCEDHKDRLIDSFNQEIMYFDDCLIKDIFQKELKPFNEILYFERDEDFFVFKTECGDNEVLRVKCPITRDSKIIE